MKAIPYYVEFDTGKIHKGHAPFEGRNGLETYGYQSARKVSKLMKAGDTDGALMAANNGIEWKAAKE